MRKQVLLPMIIADGDLTGALAIKRPGLNTTFLADYVARQCGYYASPPMRSNCALSVTHHGSGHPELGAVQHHQGANGSKLSYSPTPDFPTAAQWVQAVNTDGTSDQEITYVMSLAGGAVSTNNGGEFLWEGLAQVQHHRERSAVVHLLCDRRRRALHQRVLAAVDRPAHRHLRPWRRRVGQGDNRRPRHQPRHLELALLRGAGRVPLHRVRRRVPVRRRPRRGRRR